MNEERICTVVMTRNDVFEWQQSPRFDAMILHIPQATGDCFRFKVGNKVVVVNPQCSDFVGIEQDLA